MIHWADDVIGVDKEDRPRKKKAITIFAKPTKAISMKPMHQSIALEPEVDTKSVIDMVMDDLGKNDDGFVLEPQYEHEEKLSEEKPVESKKIVLKEWPKDRLAIIDYEDLVRPIKKIIDLGYSFKRKKDIKSFDYDGYEIGELELEVCPSPKYRFTEELLAIEKEKSSRNLIDVALNVVYLLGIENGRRVERREEQPVKAITDTINSYRETNKDLRLKNDALEAELSILKENRNASKEEVKRLVAEKMKVSRDARVKALRDDLAKDPLRNAFSPTKTSRIPFNNLVNLGKRISCSRDLWDKALARYGWAPKEFWERVEKKKVKLKFQ
jgi:hypothetical protein